MSFVRLKENEIAGACRFCLLTNENLNAALAHVKHLVPFVCVRLIGKLGVRCDDGHADRYIRCVNDAFAPCLSAREGQVLFASVFSLMILMGYSASRVDCS